MVPSYIQNSISGDKKYIQFRPSSSFAGIYTSTYTITDGDLTSTSATITINITNSPPGFNFLYF
jgi:hypothetical protein